MKYNYLLLVLMLVIGLPGCYEKKSGCLDIAAVNYDASADEDCSDCCLYPSIKIAMDHLFGNGTLVFNDTLFTNQNHAFLLLDQKFYLGAIAFMNEKGFPLTLQNQTPFTLKDGTTRSFADDYKLCIRNVSLITINTFRWSGAVASASYGPGLEEPFNDIDADIVSGSSDLSSERGMTDAENNYLTYYLKVIGGMSLKDTMEINISGRWRVNKKFNPSIPIVSGKDLVVPIAIDYNKLFQNVPFQTANAFDIKAQLMANMESAFLP
ncbi:MAG: hypothetical protein IPN29_15285 [Saprospiraceae bacterium]|nr:hypothetical protein [Saprospiraceae bacterium]